MPNDEMTRIAAANRSYGGRRSPLYRWMRTRHDALAASIEADGPAWERITETLTEAGLTDGTGKPPTLSRVRTTWYHVKRDVAAARAKTEAKRKPPVAVAPATIPLPSPASSAPWPAVGSQAAGPAPAPAAPGTGAPAAGTTVEERLRAFRASLNEGKVRIPEPINPRKTERKD